MMLPARALVWPVVLRLFVPGDAPRVQSLAGDRAVADATAIIPHPYRDGLAEAWIAGQDAERSAGTQYIYAIASADDEQLVGAIALRPIATAQENLGYWIGREFWGRGYATTATRAVVALAFTCLDCQQLTASHLSGNAASGRVLEKCGLDVVRRVVREHRGKQEEFCVRGITRDAWERQSDEN
jgi:ribosomal-protein-alanine N-acetyltransferase